MSMLALTFSFSLLTPVHDVTVLSVSNGRAGGWLEEFAVVTQPNHASTNALGRLPRGLEGLPKCDISILYALCALTQILIKRRHT